MEVESSGLTSRKKGSKLKQDAEIATEETEVPVSDANYSKSKQPTSFLVRIGCVSTWLIVIAVFVVFLFAIYVSHTPHHVLIAHKKIVDEQLLQLSKTYTEQRQAMAARMNELNRDLVTQKNYLMSRFGVASVSTEEGGVAATVPAVEAQPAATEAVVAEKEKVEEAISEEETELKKLQEEAENKKKELALFCDYCPFDYESLQTSCGKRKQYLVDTHGTPEDSAKEAVMKWDPNCKKSQ